MIAVVTEPLAQAFGYVFLLWFATVMTLVIVQMLKGK